MSVTKPKIRKDPTIERYLYLQRVFYVNYFHLNVIQFIMCLYKIHILDKDQCSSNKCIYHGKFYKPNHTFINTKDGSESYTLFIIYLCN